MLSKLNPSLLTATLLVAFGCADASPSSVETSATVRQTVGVTRAPFTRLSAGTYHTCGLTTEGEISCFGFNTYGQSVSPVGKFTDLSSRESTNCAIRAKDGSILCWGYDTGYGIMSPPSGKFIAVSVGGYHGCAIRESATLGAGPVECWGLNWSGQASAPDLQFKSVSVGMEHTCGVTAAGEMVCWGEGSQGQLDAPADVYAKVVSASQMSCGLTETSVINCWGKPPIGMEMLSAPGYTDIALSGSAFCAIDGVGVINCTGSLGAEPPVGSGFEAPAVGQFHGCAIDATGDIQCWGSTDYRQAHEVSGSFGRVSVGLNHSCALDPGGAVHCWGSSDHGATAAFPGSFSEIASGADHTCAIQAIGGAITCWGRNDVLQSSGAPPGSFKQISSGNYHTCAIKEDDTVSCWGEDTNSKAADPVGSFKMVSAGADHTCAIRLDDEKVTCWGNPGDGRTSPPPDEFTQVSSGDQHSCGIRKDGTLACWGYDSFGQASPPSGTYTHISAGMNRSCAITSAGKPVCWGDVYFGFQPTPSGTFTSISASSEVCALRSDKLLVCWGTYARNLSALKLTVAPDQLEALKLYKPFSAAITVNGGTPPYQFSLADGALPKGLKLSSTGVISGTPVEEYEGSFTVRVQDASGEFDTHEYYPYVYSNSGYVSASIVSGSAQKALVGESFTNPLVVSVAGEGPYPGVQVTFVGPNISFSQAQMLTDEEGFASVIVTPTGAAGQRKVWAYVEGMAQPLVFELTALAHPTSLELSTSESKVQQGALVTLSAALGADGNASGKVSFFIDDELVCLESLSAKKASCSVLMTKAGAHQVSAKYAGDGLNAASSAKAVAITVEPVPGYVPPDPTGTGGSSTGPGGAPNGAGGTSAADGGSSQGTGAGSAAGGSSNTAGAPGSSDGSGGASDDTSDTQGSSSCSVQPGSASAPGASALVLCAAALALMRRRRAA